MTKRSFLVEDPRVDSVIEFVDFISDRLIHLFGDSYGSGAVTVNWIDSGLCKSPEDYERERTPAAS